jgi:hypothetical protein
MLDKIKIVAEQNGIYTHAIRYVSGEDCPVSFQVVATDELDAFMQWTEYMLGEVGYALSNADRD